MATTTVTTVKEPRRISTTAIIVIVIVIILLLVGLAVGLYFAFRPDNSTGATGTTNGITGGTGANATNLNILTVPAGTTATLVQINGNTQFTQGFAMTVTLAPSLGILNVISGLSSSGDRLAAANEYNNNLFFYRYNATTRIMTVTYPLFGRGGNGLLNFGVGNNGNNELRTATTRFPLRIYFF